MRWLCGDGQWQTGSGFKGLNSNLGGVQVQQQGHMHGHLHFPGGVFSLQHSQPGLLTVAPNAQGKVRLGQQPVLHPEQVIGAPNPPLQLEHIVPPAHQSFVPQQPPHPHPPPPPYTPP